jgi:hypothetical protein
MIELIAVVCSVLSTVSCVEKSLGVYSSEDVTLMQCMMGGQFELARWAEAHPNWSIARWHCQAAGRFAKA